MKFFLQQLENHLADEILEKAEAFQENQQVSQFVELEKNLWTASVGDEENYEIEIQLKGKKVVAYSCDCGQYDAKQVCTHLAASFLVLRQHLRDQEAAKAISKSNTPSPKRLTTNIILRDISPEALKEFVRTYARNNREFTIALKARFASSVSDMDREEKYLQLLATAIKAVKRQNRGINLQGLKKIVAVIDKLQEQAYENIALKNYQEAYAMINGIFEKTPSALRKAETNKELLLKSLSANLSLLEELLEAPIAPPLRASIWEYLVQLYDNAYLKLYDFDQELLIFIKAAFYNPEQLQKLIQSIAKRLEDPNLSPEAQTFMLTNQLDLYISSRQKEKASALISKNISTPEILLVAIDMAVKRKDAKKVIQLAKLGLTLQVPKAVQSDLEEFLYIHSKILYRKKEVIRWAKKRYLDTYQKDYWEELKKQAKEEWPKHKEDLIDLISNKVFSVAQRDALAWIFASEKDFQELFTFLKETRSIELLIEYDTQLPNSFQPKLLNLYDSLLMEYLNQHVGRQTSLKVRRVLDHLTENDSKDFSQSLANKLRKEFAERNSLIEELADL